MEQYVLYLTCGATDFRKQINGLSVLVTMKFQWPFNKEDICQINQKQMEWLLDGLNMEQVKVYHNVKITGRNVCF